MLISILSAMVGISQIPAPKPSDGVILTFFVKGEGVRPDAAELQKMQSGHLDNMRHQASLGNLVAAGPCLDPDKRRRGITVLALPRDADLKPIFSSDPFVQNHIMEVESGWWKVSADRFNPAVDPNQMASYCLVLYRRGMGKSPITAVMKSDRLKFIEELKKSGEWTVSGELIGMGYTFAAISNKTDAPALMARLQEDVFVKRNLETVEVIPLFMSKEVVKP